MQAEGISRARGLAMGRPLTIDDIHQMNAFFARHEIDKQGSSWSTRGKGWQAWMGWGGDAGMRWVRRIINMESLQSSAQSSPAESSDHVGSTRSGGKIGKASPNANYNVQGGSTIVGNLGRDQGGRFSSASKVNQGGGVNNTAPTPIQVPTAGQPGEFDYVEPLGGGQYRDKRTGKIMTLAMKVPKDEQKTQNEQNTKTYLESSGLKPTFDALSQLAVGATEGISNDTKQRLVRAGLIEDTLGGIQISVHGKAFIATINANKDIAQKERLIKQTLYNAEVTQKTKDAQSQIRQQAQQQKQQTQRPAHLSSSPRVNQALYNQLTAGLRPGHYLLASSRRTKQANPQRVNYGSYGRIAPIRQQSYNQNHSQFIQRAIGMNDTLRKDQSFQSFKDDAEGNGMAMSQLYAISDKAKQLAEMLSTKNIGLESWQQSKVTTASDDIGAVYDAVKYRSAPDTKKMLIQKNQGQPPDTQKEDVALANPMNDFYKFASFEKASPDQRVVVGYASSERVDGQNDIVDSEALNQALGDYMQWANLREMHQPKAVGKVLSATPIRGTIQLKDGSKLTNPLRIVAQIIDDDTWEKVKQGVLKGFSIGGKVLQANTSKMGGKDVRRITGMQLHEISLVDRPANPDARIVLMKRDDSLNTTASETKTAVDNPTLQKAGQTDPSKILPQLQQLRNQAEIDGDLEQAERYNEVISLMLEAMGVIPQGVTRNMNGIENGTEPNANPMNPSAQTPNPDAGADAGNQGDMMDMNQAFAYNPAYQQSSNVAYAQMPEDLQKAGRTISSATNAQLDQMMQAVQYIMGQIQALQAQSQPQQPQQPQQGGAPQPQQGGAPQDMSAVPTQDVPVQPENPQQQVQAQPQQTPQQPASSMAPSPDTMAMLRGIGNPVLSSAQATGDLSKNVSIDVAAIEKEVQNMEQMTEASAPEMKDMEGTPSTENVVDALSKSLTSLISTQLGALNKQIEELQASSKEQSTAIFDTVNPLTEAVNTTKSMVEPLVEKVESLAQRLEALENTPVGNSPVLRGTAVAKALGNEASTTGVPSQVDELGTLYKMIDETDNPIIRRKLREEAALLETKRIFR